MTIALRIRPRWCRLLRMPAHTIELRRLGVPTGAATRLALSVVRFRPPGR